MNQSFEILRYRTTDGEQPYKEWVNNLKDRQAANLIRARVDRLEDGHFGKIRYIDQKVWEMKIDFGPGYRVFYLHDGDRILLLCGGDKNSQERDICRAVRYAADYWRRK